MIARDTILTAAQKLFARFGYKKTTVDEIAAAAHIAKSTLYHHFPSKEDIFQAVIESEGRELARRINLAVDAAISPKEKLRAYVVTRMYRLNELANFYSALRDEYLEYYPFVESIRKKDFNDEISMLQKILTDGEVDGTFDFKNSDVELTSLALFTALKGLEYPWNINAEIPEISKHADVLLHVLFHGILSDMNGDMNKE